MDTIHYIADYLEEQHQLYDQRDMIASDPDFFHHAEPFLAHYTHTNSVPCSQYRESDEHSSPSTINSPCSNWSSSDWSPASQYSQLSSPPLDPSRTIVGLGFEDLNLDDTVKVNLNLPPLPSAGPSSPTPSTSSLPPKKKRRSQTSKNLIRLPTPPSSGAEDVAAPTLSKKNDKDIYVVLVFDEPTPAHATAGSFIHLTPSPTTPNLFTSTSCPSQSWLLTGSSTITPDSPPPHYSPTTTYTYHHFPPSTLRLAATPSKKTALGSPQWWKLQVCLTAHKKCGGGWWRGADKRPARCVDHFAGCCGGKEVGKLARAIQRGWKEGTTKRKRGYELVADEEE